MKFSVKEILDATGGQLISGRDNIYFSNISIDSRTTKNGELFLALKGKNFDGHDFIEDAFNKVNISFIKIADSSRQEGSIYLFVGYKP